MTAALSAVFLISGASALLFETLWFRQAGLALGNSVWASSLVTASFMGGLAFGNALAAGWGDKLNRPLFTYAKLEGLIGFSGLGLVFLFPVLTPLMAPVLGDLLAYPAALNAARLLTAFVLLLIPATAMGATLPLLVRTLTERGIHFGSALGTLYGWNTLGAVAGALLGEMVLIGYLGIRGTAFVAALLNVVAAAGAIAVNKMGNHPVCARASRGAATPPNLGGELGDGTSDSPPKLGGGVVLLIAAAFLSGALLLALEVVWFRFLLLFVLGTTQTFAIMLAVVLLGIGAGGILASWWLKWQSNASQFLPFVALAAGFATAQTYATLSSTLGGGISWPAIYLMLPTSLLSGTLFTLLGSRLKENSSGTTRTAGLLTLSNTGGAMVGALIGGFLLLPYAGIERSFLILSAAYGVVAILTTSRRRIAFQVLGAGIFAALLALFPSGLMRNQYVRRVAEPFLNEMAHIVAVREGLTETLLYIRQDLAGEPYFYRLVTNGFSMSGTTTSSKRYMGLYVYLPIALQPNARRALLISYGVGNTAKALTDTAGLEHIDVVDTSRDIIEMSQQLLPLGKDPLKDPRVTTYIEDGRFFLLTTKNQYELITAEPPPPKSAGIVNLYSREYFHLIRARLAPGGVASYWLPVYQLSRRDAMAVIGGFCDAFADCTLWSGYGAEWMLVGTKDLRARFSEEAFTRQWRDPVVRSTLQTVGFEEPETLGAAFIADSAQLSEWTRDVPPLEDNYPQRLSSQPAYDTDFFQTLQSGPAIRGRFAQSAFVKTLWPEALRSRTLERFDQLDLLNRYAWTAFVPASIGLPDLHSALVSTRMRTPVLWIMGGSDEVHQIAERLASRGVADSSVHEIFGISAMADRNYLAAERHFSQAQSTSQRPETVAQWRVLALSLAGQSEQAKAIIEGAGSWFKPRDREGWTWLSTTFSLPKIADN